MARHFDGDLVRRPTRDEMHAEIARALDWKRRGRRVAALFGGLCVAPYHHAHFDELMRDMGARTRPGNPLVAYLAPLSPRRYAGLLATAPGHAPATGETAR